jgi:integrase
VNHKVCIGRIKGDIPCGAALDKLKRSKKVKYWISYRVPGGKQRLEFVGYSIQEAKDAEGKRRSQKRENRIFDIKPDSKMTFNELTKWYLALSKVKTLSSYWRIELSLRKFNSEFGDMIISHIKPVDLENYQATRHTEGKADATIDQEIGAAKTAIIKAFDNGIVSGDSLKVFRVVKKLLKVNSNARDRVLSPEEFQNLLDNSPSYLKAILTTGYYTGMRRGEILNLTWDRVDISNRVIRLMPQDTKDKEARTIPICDNLMTCLKSLPRSITNRHVFLYRGEPVKDIRASLKGACGGAGIPYGRFTKAGFIFHDLRHTFNTYMRKAGVPESVIMEITGHSTRQMFDRYNTIDLEDTRQAVDQMGAYLKSVDQIVDQTSVRSKQE